MSSSNNVVNRVRVAAIWIFLAPLITILGTIDILTNGRTRNWPLDK